MAFIIQMFGTDFSPASLTIERREDALETALNLADQGHVGVRIIGDGRIYNPAEFSLTVAIEEFVPERPSIQASEDPMIFKPSTTATPP